MKKNKLLWVLIPLLIVLIVFLIVLAVLLITVQKDEERYYEQMEVAEIYMEDMDYAGMIQAYETAIELMPEDPDAYIALSEYYLEQGKYFDATSVAEMGYQNTGSVRLEKLIAKIKLTRINQSTENPELLLDSALEEKEDSPKLLIRNNIMGDLGEYCYQQYINEYGDADVKYMSEEEGYRVKFKGLSAYAYFKDTPENSNAIDKTAKRPLPLAKPYKIEIQNPQLLFVGFEGYISSDRLGEIFNLLPMSVLEEIDDSYYLVFEYLGCEVKIETDASGNVVKNNPMIEMYPLNLVSNWVDEEETEEKDLTDTQSNNGFMLAGEFYDYNITELYIWGETLDDLSPLANCKQLEFIAFIGCRIDDLSPLAECTALEEVNLQDSYGNLELSHLSNLPNLKYLGFHECKDIDDITCLYGKELDILHPCGSSVTIEQCLKYQELYPYCEVWFDYYYPIRY